ncbi:hypothetical protein ANCDUO_11555 [Ancylostoma duodenale]|uniref:ABC1 atypical kinase-like domain-containing protein n=1 Tax=Ancylostoma duodenale TaxID=51022 RepID=A0A0C2D7V4_9BILA|nr:hypothetical protein ANCDUO_11555 [Ancylostoma duodenale]
MPVRASTSTLKWCREEGGPIFTGLRLIFRSQLGYEGRRLQDNLIQSCLRTMVGGGGVIDPSTPKPTSPSQWTLPESATDVLQRTNAVATGIRTFAELIAKGIFPGTGGYTVSPTGEKIYGYSTSPSPSVISGLSKMAELISKGAIALPNVPLPNLQKLGEEVQEKPYFKDSDFVKSKFSPGVSGSEPRMVLLDFGASRSYSKKFVDRYMNIIKAASDADTKKIIEHSREIGFLTGYETEIMEKAHAESVLIMGETLASSRPFDFSRQSVTKRIQNLLPIMLEHRLTSPPEEIYSLHRKLSGSYLLATKLKAVVSCGGLFNEIYENYKFGEDGKDIDIDTPANSSEQANS